MAEVRPYGPEDARRESAVEMMMRQIQAHHLPNEYRADIEYLEHALIAFADEWTETLREAGEKLAAAVRGLDSYAALGGAPMERTERADAALAEWVALASRDQRRTTEED